MGLSWKKLVLPTVLTTTALLFFVTTGSAQCSMCRAALAGSNNALFIRNFNIGVLVLLVPPVSIFCSIFIVLKRSRDHDYEPDSDFRNSKPETRN